MKIKIILTTLSTIIAPAMTPIFAAAQNNSLTPDAAGQARTSRTHRQIFYFQPFPSSQKKVKKKPKKPQDFFRRFQR